MSDDFSKKMGKQGLKNLLNKKEPEIEYDDVPDMTGGNRDMFGNDTYRYPRSYGGGYGYGNQGGRYAGKNAFNGDGLGRPVSSGRANSGRPMCDVLYKKQGSKAVVTDKEWNRYVGKVAEALRVGLQSKGLHWKFGDDMMIEGYLSDMLFDVDIRLRTIDGEALTIVHEDALGEGDEEEIEI